jgi:hypothetical protein
VSPGGLLLIGLGVLLISQLVWGDALGRLGVTS